VTPDPPKPGRKLTIEASGKVNTLIDVRNTLYNEGGQELTRLRRAGGNVCGCYGQVGLDQAVDEAVRRVRRAVSGPVLYFLPERQLMKPFARSDNANATLSCPIKPNSYNITQNVDLPAEIPRGASEIAHCAVHPCY
jgi:hypothetical protein